MPPATKSSRQLSHGATRRAPTPPDARIDRWLNLVVSLSVITALIVGSVALMVTLLFH
ncbi:hypothetical protein ACUN9V_08070 [Salinicola sp. V024]|uniref:hypothetical protein n=1 Tax=Salinicola TaxID=404432 RepID=UPI000A9D48FC|nr:MULTISPECIES: hypothetical protein [Salinicola]